MSRGWSTRRLTCGVNDPTISSSTLRRISAWLSWLWEKVGTTTITCSHGTTKHPSWAPTRPTSPPRSSTFSPASDGRTTARPSAPLWWLPGHNVQEMAVIRTCGDGETRICHSKIRMWLSRQVHGLLYVVQRRCCAQGCQRCHCHHQDQENHSVCRLVPHRIQGGYQLPAPNCGTRW
uniref:Uncharacterized protein n=1 Tax=Cacopsylla melanoneura TaxID=428564 RepID=A0A8D8UAD8_9HEMI